MGDNETIATLGTFFFISLPFILWIVLGHQRKMAEIIHARNQASQKDAFLIQQMQELRSVVAQQAILMDSIAQSQQALMRQGESGQDVSVRLGASR